MIKRMIRTVIATVMMSCLVFTGVTAASAEEAPNFSKCSKQSGEPFRDVRAGMEHYKAMEWAYNCGLVKGWSDGTFRPTTAINRDAMIAILYRLEGSPKLEHRLANPFSDVHEGMEHYDAIVWAGQTGISMGWEMPDGTFQFRPLQPVKRDAMAAFFYRMAGYPEVYNHWGFKDVSSNDEFSLEMRWMKQTGIATGWKDGTYRALNNTNRDAMVAFLYRAHSKNIF